MSENNKTKKPFNWKALIAGLVFITVFFLFWIGTVWAWGWNFNGGTIFFIKNIILNNFLGVDAMLIGILVLVGYLILGRGVSDSIIGMLKAIMGVLILKIGAGTLVGIAKPIFIGISKLGGASVVPLDPYFGWASSQNWLGAFGNSVVSWISYSLLIGLFLNIILISLRRWTNVHSLMITGHVMFQQSAMVVPTIFFTMFAGPQFVDPLTLSIKPGIQVAIIIISGLILGSYWGIASTATIKGTDAVTQNAGFAVGHQQMFGLSIAYGIGKYFGKKEDSAETRKMSNRFKIFEDNVFTQSLIIFVVFLVLILILQFGTKNASIQFWDTKTYAVNGAYGSWQAGGKEVFFLINLLLGSLKLVGAILVLQMGVRMFVTELQQSFQGISEKLVPGAVVAVDVAATYGFSPNSVTYGFVSGTISQYIAALIMIGISLGLSNSHNSFQLVAVVPLFITLFFNSGSIGVFANASGGIKAAIIVPAIFGFCEIVTISLGLSMMQNFSSFFYNTPFTLGYNGMFDWTFVFGSLMIIATVNSYAAYTIFSLYFVALYFVAQFVDSNRQKKATIFQKLVHIKPNLEFEKEVETQTA